MKLLLFIFTMIIAVGEVKSSTVAEKLIHLAADNASIGDIEDALSSKNFEYRKDASVEGGFRVDTEKQYKGWAMMQIFSPDNVSAIFGIAAGTGGAAEKVAGRSAAKGVSRVAAKKGAEVAAKEGMLYTKSSLKFGQQMHKTYKVGDVVPDVAIKEFRRIPGIRPDFVDLSTKTIYELKPFNPRGIQMGTQQLNRYKSIFEQKYGGIWNTVLDLY